MDTDTGSMLSDTDVAMKSLDGATAGSNEMRLGQVRRCITCIMRIVTMTRSGSLTDHVPPRRENQADRPSWQNNLMSRCINEQCDV